MAMHNSPWLLWKMICSIVYKPINHMMCVLVLGDSSTTKNCHNHVDTVIELSQSDG